MNHLKVYILATFRFLISAFFANGQTITSDTIAYKTVSEINAKNDSIIDNSKYPDWQNASNLVIENTSFRSVIDTSWVTKQIKDIIANWKKNNNIKDDGATNHYYGLVKGFGDTYSVKKLTGTVDYFFGEIGGGYKIDRTIVIQEKGMGEILCLFDKSIVLDEKQVHLHFIRPTQAIKFPHESIFREKILEKNVKFGFAFSNIKYDLYYSADLSQNGFSYGGFGTIYPTYFNIELKLQNKDSGIEQALFKYPHSISYNISEIIIGDIDNDSQPDIIYKICDEICIRRVIFLSSKKESNQLLKYIGQTKNSCWDP